MMLDSVHRFSLLPHSIFHHLLDFTISSVDPTDDYRYLPLVSSELARRRISQATLQQRIKLAEETVENRNLTLKIVERRYRRGIADTATGDVYPARENMAAAASQIPNLKRQLSEQFHLVDVLLGLPPGTTTPEEISMAQLPPPDAVSVGLPARLLDNRPDLRTNELRMAAGVERIGVAVADL